MPNIKGTNEQQAIALRLLANSIEGKEQPLSQRDIIGGYRLALETVIEEMIAPEEVPKQQTLEVEQEASEPEISEFEIPKVTRSTVTGVIKNFQYWEGRDPKNTGELISVFLKKSKKFNSLLDDGEAWIDRELFAEAIRAFIVNKAKEVKASPPKQPAKQAKSQPAGNKTPKYNISPEQAKARVLGFARNRDLGVKPDAKTYLGRAITDYKKNSSSKYRQHIADMAARL